MNEKILSSHVPSLPGLFRNKRPKFIEVDGRAKVVRDVGVNVEVPHTNLAEVSRMVLVEVDPKHDSLNTR